MDSIDELVLILKESEQSDMLRRVGYCRKRVMGLLRLLVPKADVVKTLIKRGETKPDDATRPELSTEVSLFLGDVQGKNNRTLSSEWVGGLTVPERRSHPYHAAIPQSLRKNLITIPQQLFGTNLD